MRTVNVAQNEAQQFGALNDTFFDKAPLVGRNEQRNEIDLPGTADALRIAVDVIGDAVFADAALGAGKTFFQFVRAEFAQRLNETGPVAARRYAIGGQFIEHIRIMERGLQQVRNHVASAALGRMIWPDVGQRKSRVIGMLGFFSSAGGVMGPGVWPKLWKRSWRRLSASAALTGRVV